MNMPTLSALRHCLASFANLSHSSSKSQRFLSSGGGFFRNKSANKPANIFVLMFALLLLGALSLPAHAQGVSFVGLQVIVPASGLENPTFAAVDGAGNVFIVDHGSYQVVKVTPSGIQTTVPTSGLNNPNGIALDAAGDVFVADVVNNRVVEVPYLGNGTYGSQTTVPATLSHPYGVALDAAGDIFIADTGNKRVAELPYLGGGNYGTQITLPFSGLADPFGVALDGAGDVFVADFGATSIMELPYLGSGNYGTQVSIGSGLGGPPIGGPEGVAVDANGNVFAADTNNSRVVEIPYVGNGNYGAQTTVGSGLSEPTGVALDGKGDVYIVDNGNHRVEEVELVAPNFGYVNVGSNNSLTLTYNINSSVVLAGTPTVVTQGAPNLDFTLSGSPTCTGAQTAPTTCTVSVQFAPLAPGLRQGAVQLYDSSNNLLVTTLIRGYGTAPQLAFPGGPVSNVWSEGNGYPQDAEPDAAGDLFLAENNDFLLKIPAGCSSSSCWQHISGPDTGCEEGVAVDGAGNVYASDLCNGHVYLVPRGCTDTGCESTVLSVGAPAHIALDGAGDLFVPDNYNGHPLDELRVVGGLTTVGSGLDGPFGVAVDPLANVFVADPSFSYMVEVPSVGKQSNFGSLGCPAAVQVDAAEDIFVTDACAGGIEYPAGCTDNACSLPFGSGLSSPEGVGLDAMGDLFIADQNNSRVQEVQRSQAPTLSFGSITVDTTSSPQTVMVQNIGNQPLAFASFEASTNFVVDSGTTTCSTSSPLAVGAACNVGVDFAPATTGPLTGTLTLTDNALNATSATQTVNLSGTGVAPCAAGTYSSTGNTPCTPAPAGSYVSGPGATSATPCSAGSYQPNSGQTACIASPAGSYVSGPGATAATQCSAGSYQPNTGQTACIASPAGSYVSGPGATAATQCNAGSYQPNTGQTSCIASPAGSAVAGPGATAATLCSAGSYQPNTGQAACIASPAGSYVSGPGATAATQCNAGSYQPNTGQTSCIASPAGSAVAGPGATAATLCSAGSYQPNTGQTSCIPSPAGSYVPGGGATGSMLCTAGSYQPNTGQASCILAGIGYYVPNPGQTNEDQCPSGETTTAPGATACVPDALTASPSSFAFPNLAPLESYAKLILVENISASKLTVGAATITATGGDANAFTIHQFCEPATLKPQHSCYIGVTFKPHQLGLSTATMNIPFTGTGSPLEVPLTGTGIPRAGKVTASPTSFNFGNVTVGTYSNAQEITLSNTGGKTVTISNIAGLASPFLVQSNNCPTALTSGAQCDVYVQFAPSATGLVSQTLKFTDSALDSPQSVTLSGTGQ